MTVLCYSNDPFLTYRYPENDLAQRASFRSASTALTKDGVATRREFHTNGIVTQGA